MIYLDYAENTPESLEATNAYLKANKEFLVSPKASSVLGDKTRTYLNEITRELSDIFNIMSDEIIYTSGATEANNMALIGAAIARFKTGKHIIVSKLEHPSIYKICEYLESIGFEISYLNNDNEGLVSFDELKRLIREDTILVSIAALNYETGVRQPLKMIRQIIKKENPNTLFHSDLSHALGRMQINFRDIDLGSVSSHKIYGPSGIGFLYKNSSIKLAPILYGNKKESYYKPGNPPIALITAMKEAIKTALKELDKKEKYVTLINERIVSKLEKLEGIEINKTKYSVPFILNISLKNINSIELANRLAANDICVSTNLPKEISPSVMAIYNDINRSKNTIRISLSHLTRIDEINRFLETFLVEYNSLGGE